MILKSVDIKTEDSVEAADNDASWHLVPHMRQDQKLLVGSYIFHNATE